MSCLASIPQPKGPLRGINSISFFNRILTRTSYGKAFISVVKFLTCEVVSDTGTHALNTNVVWFIDGRKTCAKFEIDAAIVYVRRYMLGSVDGPFHALTKKKNASHTNALTSYK